MGSTIELKCLDTTCDQVAGLNVLLSHAKIARETMAIAMKCADALAVEVQLPAAIMRDSIVLTDFTPEMRGFEIKIGIGQSRDTVSVHRRKGERLWTVWGPFTSVQMPRTFVEPSAPESEFMIQMGMIESTCLLGKVPEKVVQNVKHQKATQKHWDLVVERIKTGETDLEKVDANTKKLVEAPA